MLTGNDLIQTWYWKAYSNWNLNMIGLCMMNRLIYKWLTDSLLMVWLQLTDGLFDWLIDWFIGGLTDILIDKLIDGWIYGFIDRSIYWLVEGLIYWLID